MSSSNKFCLLWPSPDPHLTFTWPSPDLHLTFTWAWQYCLKTALILLEDSLNADCRLLEYFLKTAWILLEECSMTAWRLIQFNWAKTFNGTYLLVCIDIEIHIYLILVHHSILCYSQEFVEHPRHPSNCLAVLNTNLCNPMHSHQSSTIAVLNSDIPLSMFLHLWVY